jgi:hypothetical protein
MCATPSRSSLSATGRYPVKFDRIVTPRFTKEVESGRDKIDMGDEELDKIAEALVDIIQPRRSPWNADIRQILSDNAIKDLLADIDASIISGIREASSGSSANG